MSARPHHIPPGPIGGVSDTAVWDCGSNRGTITRGSTVEGRGSSEERAPQLTQRSHDPVVEHGDLRRLRLSLMPNAERSLSDMDLAGRSERRTGREGECSNDGARRRINSDDPD